MTRILEAIFVLAVATQIIPSHHAPPIIRPVAASGILSDLASTINERLFPPDDYIDYHVETKTLSIVDISEMRARDIKRRLARNHGYGADELARMIDKKDLINTLSFEEHKVYQQEMERRKWRRFKTTVIYTCVAVLVVMFWPLLRHALEVAHVNFVVYTDRRRHELSRCHEFQSFKGYIGIFLLFIIDMLTFWLSTSVLLSWVMTSKYFFPTPNIPVRPVELLTPKGHDPGAFGKYGINIGPMIISWFFRFLSGRVEGMIGKALSDAFQNQRIKEKEEMKRRRKEERVKEKEVRRAAKKEAKEIARDIARQRDSEDFKRDHKEKSSKSDDLPAESIEQTVNNNSFIGGHEFSFSNFDEID